LVGWSELSRGARRAYGYITQEALDLLDVQQAIAAGRKAAYVAHGVFVD